MLFSAISSPLIDIAPFSPRVITINFFKFGEILGKVIAPIVMAVVYFLILTPISLLVRLFGKDLIEMKFNNNVKSYWIKRKKHLGTMDKQF